MPQIARLECVGSVNARLVPRHLLGSFTVTVNPTLSLQRAPFDQLLSDWIAQWRQVLLTLRCFVLFIADNVFLGEKKSFNAATYGTRRQRR
jgi:hypothetical protein